MGANPKFKDEVQESAWRGFVPGTWQTRVNVREFIQRNYTPYEGDGAFLAGPTERTLGMWKKLQPLLVGFLLFQRQFVQSFMRAGIR